MIKVKVGELRNNLSKYLKKIRLGGEIIITDRDNPIGRLSSYEKNSQENFDIIPPKDGWGNLPKMKFTHVPLDYDILEDLMKDRKKR